MSINNFSDYVDKVTENLEDKIQEKRKRLRETDEILLAELESLRNNRRPSDSARKELIMTGFSQFNSQDSDDIS